MKISAMTNDQAADAIIKITPAISNIFDDQNSQELIDKLSKAEGMTQQELFGKLLPEILAYCMKDHKQDVYAIVGALMCKPVSEVGKMNFIQTVKEIKNSIDDDLLGFFKSSGTQTEMPGN